MEKNFKVEKINYCQMANHREISFEEAYINILHKRDIACTIDSEAFLYYQKQSEEIIFMIAVHHMFEKGYDFDGTNFVKIDNNKKI